MTPIVKHVAPTYKVFRNGYYKVTEKAVQNSDENNNIIYYKPKHITLPEKREKFQKI